MSHKRPSRTTHEKHDRKQAKRRQAERKRARRDARHDPPPPPAAPREGDDRGREPAS